MKHVIWDLDNCLANDAPRLKLIDWTQTNPDLRYGAYHAACAGDEVCNRGIFETHCGLGHKPIFLTARPVDVWAETRHWIDHNLGCKSYNLIMRNKGDHRASVHVKRWMLDNLPLYGIDHRDIVHCYDDHPEIVAMYRGLGLSAGRLKIHDGDAYNAPKPDAPKPDAPAPAIGEVDKIEVHDDGNIVDITRTPTGRAILDAIAKHADCADCPEGFDARDEHITRWAPINRAAITAGDVLSEMAETFAERNEVYRDNYKMIPKLVKVLFPGGVPPELVLTPHWHLFEIKLVKLARFAATGLTHIDSIHDDAIYSAMIEAILTNQESGA